MRETLNEFLCHKIGTARHLYRDSFSKVLQKHNHNAHEFIIQMNGGSATSTITTVVSDLRVTCLMSLSVPSSLLCSFAKKLSVACSMATFRSFVNHSLTNCCHVFAALLSQVWQTAGPECHSFSAQENRMSTITLEHTQYFRIMQLYP